MICAIEFFLTDFCYKKKINQWFFCYDFEFLSRFLFTKNIKI